MMGYKFDIVIPDSLVGKERSNFYQRAYYRLNRETINKSATKRRKKVQQIKAERTSVKTKFNASDIQKMPFGRIKEIVSIFKGNYTYIPIRR